MLRRYRLVTAGFCAALLVPSVGCNDLVLQNLVLGLRDGTLSAAAGIIEGSFNQTFGLEPEGDEEEGGDDLHVRL